MNHFSLAIILYLIQTVSSLTFNKYEIEKITPKIIYNSDDTITSKIIDLIHFMQNKDQIITYKQNLEEFPSIIILINNKTKEESIIELSKKNNYYDSNKIKIKLKNFIPGIYYLYTLNSQMKVLLNQNKLEFYENYIIKNEDIILVHSDIISPISKKLIIKKDKDEIVNVKLSQYIYDDFIDKIYIENQNENLDYYIDNSYNNGSLLIINIPDYVKDEGNTYKLNINFKLKDTIKNYKLDLIVINDPKFTYNTKLYYINQSIFSNTLEITADSSIISNLYTEAFSPLTLKSKEKNQMTFLYPFNDTSSKILKYKIVSNDNDFYDLDISDKLNIDDDNCYFIYSKILIPINIFPNSHLSQSELSLKYSFETNKLEGDDILPYDHSGKLLIQNDILFNYVLENVTQYGDYFFEIKNKSTNEIIYKKDIIISGLVLNTYVLYHLYVNRNENKLTFFVSRVENNHLCFPNLYVKNRDIQTYPKIKGDCELNKTQGFINCKFGVIGQNKIKNGPGVILDENDNVVIPNLDIDTSFNDINIIIQEPNNIILGRNKIVIRFAGFGFRELQKLVFVDMGAGGRVYIDKINIEFHSSYIIFYLDITKANSKLYLYQIFFNDRNKKYFYGYFDKTITVNQVLEKNEINFMYINSLLKNQIYNNFTIILKSSKMLNLNLYLNDLYIIYDNNNTENLTCESNKYNVDEHFCNINNLSNFLGLKVPFNTTIKTNIRKELNINYYLFGYNISQQLCFLYHFNSEVILNIFTKYNIDNYLLFLSSKKHSYPLYFNKITNEMDNYLQNTISIQINKLNEDKYTIYLVDGDNNVYTIPEVIEIKKVNPFGNIIIKNNKIKQPYLFFDKKDKISLLMHIYSQTHNTDIKSIFDYIKLKYKYHDQIIPQYSYENKFKYMPLITLNLYQPFNKNLKSFYSNYKIIANLSHGSEGDVIKINNNYINRGRALKNILKIHSRKSPSLKKIVTINQTIQAYNEIHIIRSIDHPFLLKIFKVFEDDNNFKIVSELYQNKTLKEAVKKERQYSEGEVSLIIFPIFYSVCYLHSMNITHNDIATGNIMVNKYVNNLPIGVKLIDFGNSRNVSSEEEFTIESDMEKVNEINMKKYDILTLGSLLFRLLAKTNNVKLDELTKIYKIREKLQNFSFETNTYSKKFSPEARDLLKKLIVIEPEKRVDVFTAIKHKFFQVHNSKEKYISYFINENDIYRMLKYIYKFSAVYYNVLQIEAFKYIIHSNFNNDDEIHKSSIFFMKIDLDNNGRISKDEFLNLKEIYLTKENEIFNGKYKFNSIFFEELFHIIDVDHSGFIESEEFAIAAIQRKKFLDDINEIRNTFFHFDFDDDGYISIDDLKYFFNIYNEDESNKLIEIKNIIRQFDRNFDGKLDIFEFETMLLYLK